jgi:hypothetical protein
VDGACGMRGIKEKCIQSFGGKTGSLRGLSIHEWVDGIERDHKMRKIA